MKIVAVSNYNDEMMDDKLVCSDRPVEASTRDECASAVNSIRYRRLLSSASVRELHDSMNVAAAMID